MVDAAQQDEREVARHEAEQGTAERFTHEQKQGLVQRRVAARDHVEDGDEDHDAERRR